MPIERVEIGYLGETYGELRVAVPPGDTLDVVPARAAAAETLANVVANTRMPDEPPLAFLAYVLASFRGRLWARALPDLPDLPDLADSPSPEPRAMSRSTTSHEATT